MQEGQEVVDGQVILGEGAVIAFTYKEPPNVNQ